MAKTASAKRTPSKKQTPLKRSKAIRKTPKKTASKSITYQKTITMYKSIPDYFTMNKKYAHLGFNSRAIHAGNEPEQEFGAVAPAIHMSTTFIQSAPGEAPVFDYQRCGNPTRLQLERNLASLEHTKYAFAMASGMSATVTVMNILKSGDHVLCIDDVYGGTQRYLKKIICPNFGLELTMSDFSDIKKFKQCIKKNTKVVWLETPTNPTLKVFDIQAIANALKGTGIIFVVDNTFATPVLQSPALLGADIVMHSATKYIGGHSDVVCGALCLNDLDLYKRLDFAMKTVGTGASPFDCWIALRGTKTLGIRVERASQNALAIAKMLESHPKVEKCVYPGLKSHPQHAIAKKQMRQGGGMISFFVKGGLKQADRFLRALKVVTLAESLGGVESLIEHPAIMTHGSVPAEHRKMLGIDDNFIRMSVGIEDEADLLADMKQALEKM